MANLLVTGGLGFLGQHICASLSEHRVFTLGRHEGNDFVGNLSDDLPELTPMDYVVHAAGKAHVVPKTDQEKELFYKVNREGTKNLTRALEKLEKKVRGFVFISTVAVYGKEEGALINEEQKLSGETPYADSKIKAEEHLLDWGREKGVPILILRLPLIAGKKPPGNLGKMISGIQSGKYLSIAKGKAKRSVVLADDVGNFIAANLGKSGIYNLSDGIHPSFREIEEVICRQLDRGRPANIPLWLAKLLGKFGDVIPLFPVNSQTIIKMTSDLTFSDQKARKELNWNPKKVTEHFLIQ